MVNDWGVKCPVNWDNVRPEHNWVTVNPDGKVWSYNKRPILHENIWKASDFGASHIGTTEYPTFSEWMFIWERPRVKYLAVVKTEYEINCYETTVIELYEKPTNEQFEKLKNIMIQDYFLLVHGELADKLKVSHMNYRIWKSIDIKMYELL